MQSVVGTYFRLARENEVIDEDGYFHGYICQMDHGIELDRSRPVFSIEALKEYLDKTNTVDTGEFVATARKLKFPEEKTARDLFYDDMYALEEEGDRVRAKRALPMEKFMNLMILAGLSERERVAANLFGGSAQHAAA